jgi:DNA-binding MarR family transcriptional regulator
MANEDSYKTADQLHSIAIHLLRKLSVYDQEAGMTSRRLSVLSVITFAGPLSVSRLAQIEGVSAPTISRMVKDLEYEGYVEKIPDEDDKRVQKLQVTPKGVEIMKKVRGLRINALAEQIEALSPEELGDLEQGIPVLQTLALPSSHPHRQGQELL